MKVLKIGITRKCGQTDETEQKVQGLPLSHLKHILEALKKPLDFILEHRLPLIPPLTYQSKDCPI